MTVTGRMLFAVVAALAASLVSAGTSHAGLDNELSLVDGKDRTMTIQQWDTFLDGVFPLDRKRLTREWFHSGRAKYTIDGPGVADFAGTLELGYQVGFRRPAAALARRQRRRAGQHPRDALRADDREVPRNRHPAGRRGRAVRHRPGLCGHRIPRRRHPR